MIWGILISVIIIIVFYNVLSKPDKIDVKRNVNSNNTKDKIEPFGRKFKTLVDCLGSKLWNGERFILMKQSNRQYFIQKNKLPNNESYIYIVYRTNTINLDFYEKIAGVKVTYSKTYDISDSSNISQEKIASDFANNVRLLGKMEY
jgi:hypothetical protein